MATILTWLSLLGLDAYAVRFDHAAVTTANLTSIGGPASQRVIDGLVHEIDIRTGRCCPSGTGPAASPKPTAM
jgi:hypothetical protein